MPKEEIFVIGLDNQQYIRAAQETKAEIIRLDTEQKKMKGTTEETSAAYIENSVALKDNKKNLGALEKQISNNLSQSKEFKGIRESTNRELKKEALSINDLREQNRRLLKVKNNLILTNKEESKLAKEIDDKLNQNNETIKENSDAYTQQKLNIGNYGSALSSINPQLGSLISTGQQLITGLKAQKAALAGTSSGLKLFRLALIATGIGAIVVALGLMIGFFLKTQKAVDGLTRILTPLKEVFSSIVGVLENLGAGIFEAFNNPKQTIIDLGNLIKKNITNRIEGLIEIFKILGSGSLDGLGEALSKTATGVENLGTKIKDFSNNASDFINTAVERGKLIAELGIEISKQETEIALKRESALNSIREQELITKDKSKTTKEINEALKEAERLTKLMLEDENKILDLKIQRAVLQTEANDTSREDSKEINELEAQQEANKGKARGIELRFLGTKNQLQAKAAAKAVAFEKKRLADAVANLDLELEMFREVNREKLEIDGELNEAIVEAKIGTLQLINDKELEALEFKLENGLIKEGEFNLAKLQLENDFQAEKKDLLDTLDEEQLADRNKKIELEREARAIEFELQLEENALRRATQREILLEEEAINFETDMALLTDRLESEEITQAEFDRRNEILAKQHANALDKINSDSAKAQALMEDIKKKRKIEAIKQTFNNVAELVGKETKLGKAASIAGTLINTYQSAVSAYKGMVDAIPGPVGIAAGAVAAALSVATGLATVKKITNVKEPDIPRAADGMLVGSSHKGGGININAEGGEAIINKRSMSDPFLRALASDINVAGGGVEFEHGGVIGQSSINSLINSSSGSIGQINDLIDGKIANIRVTNLATDTTETSAGVLETENIANL